MFLVPVLSIQFGLVLLQKWKRATLEQEGLKQAKIQSELISLKSHISPHFLFNNLNILSSLIDVDNDHAQDYLDKFSEVYRYVLSNRQAELVPLSEELAFLDSYIFLLTRRFPKGLDIDIQIPKQVHNRLIPPMALQILLENALKHNKLSEAHPLHISLFLMAGELPRLVVQNNLQLRVLPEVEKSGFGLENIKRRYWLIARQEIDIHTSDGNFTIRLPLLPNS